MTFTIKLDPGPKGDKGDRGDKGDPGQPATQLWAVIRSDGTIARQSGAVTRALRVSSAGQYLFTFNRDMRGCAYQATVGTSATWMTSWGSQSPPGHTAAAFAGGFSGNPADITVETFDAAGNFSARDFHVVVFCDTIPPSAQALRANAQKARPPLRNPTRSPFQRTWPKGPLAPSLRSS